MNEQEIAVISEYMEQYSNTLVHNEDAQLGFLIAVWRLSSALKALDSLFNSKLFFETVSHNAYKDKDKNNE